MIASARQRVQIGDIQRSEVMQAQQAIYDRMRR